MQGESHRMKELGNEAYKNKDYSRAMGYYTQAINLNPNDANFYSNRALCSFNLGRFMECITDCDHAIRLNPTFVKAYKKKASACANLLKFSEAVQAMKSAINCERNNQALKNELEDYESF